MPLEQLHDIKANSVAEWIAIERVRRSIAKHFRQFLTSYTDEQGNSVHYPLIRNLGESTSYSLILFPPFSVLFYRQCRIARGFLHASCRCRTRDRLFPCDLSLGDVSDL